MTEIITPPTDWAMHVDLNENDLQNSLGNHRLISIKSYVRSNQRVYSAISVKDGINGLGWTGNMTPDKLRQTVDLADGRLIALDCFWDKTAVELRCAGVWIKNATALTWNFGVDLVPFEINTMLRKEGGKLTCVRVYIRPADPGQKPPIAFEKKYCAIWIEDDGKPWNWDPDITVPALGLKVDDESARLVSIDNHSPNEWLSSDERIAAVWWKNDAGAWFWNIGLEALALEKEFPKFCSYGIDIVPVGPTQFASLMYQFPKKTDPNQVSLVSFTGHGDSTPRDDLGQDIQWHFQQQNLAPDTVQYKNAVMFVAAEGGWSWWSGDFVNPAGQTLMGLPLTIPAGGTNASTWAWTVSNNPKIGVFCLRAEDGTGKFHVSLAQTPITNSGLPAPANLPIHWPVFVGVQGPVECVKLTNGMNWVTVAAQVCNGTTRPLTITSVSVRLRHNNDILHEASFTSNLTVDQDVLGKPVNPAVIGPVVNLDVPLPKFYDGFEVPAKFTNGELKVQATVKFGGSLECFGDTRELTVALAPVSWMTRLPYNAPVNGQTKDSPFRWHWGNGIGGTSFHSHAYPEHRYSYDLGVFDNQNKTLRPGGNALRNKDYYCWNQSMVAMDGGRILFVDDSHPDNNGNEGNVDNNPANEIVIFNKEKNIYYMYAHLRQGSAKDKNGNNLVVGGTVVAGDLVGKVGNSGGSTQPHMHVGISRRDNEGFLRGIPMSFNKIKDGNGNVVSGVPVDGEYYE